MEQENTGHKCVVIGATGAVGSNVTLELLASKFCSQVTALVRRETNMFEKAVGSDKLKLRLVKMDQLEQDATLVNDLKDHPYAFCALGVGSVAGTPNEEIRVVEQDYVLSFAKVCKKAGVRHFSWLGAAGADKKSSLYAAKLKAIVEDDLTAVGFDRLSLFRPSVIQTPEWRYGARDILYQGIFPKISWMLPNKWHHVKVEDLGRAMRVNAEKTTKQGVEILHYPEFEQILALDPRVKSDKK